MPKSKILIVEKNPTGFGNKLQRYFRSKGFSSILANTNTSIFKSIDDQAIEIVFFLMCMSCKGPKDCCKSFYIFVDKHFDSTRRPKYQAEIGSYEDKKLYEKHRRDNCDFFLWPLSLEVLSNYCCDRLFEKVGTEYYLDPIRMEVVFVKGAVASLTAMEFQILSLFREKEIWRISREEVVARVWRSRKIGVKTLEMHLSQLRKKLKPLSLNVSYLGNQEYELLRT